ncbi:MAG: right-handed parallel beta-helix repeat-containing protein, partial [Kiritimatiellae bacterium]|nr:right-handed parallel beta-helix repeat-containing protein [Kiritimatiellia bacterium]
MKRTPYNWGFAVAAVLCLGLIASTRLADANPIQVVESKKLTVADGQAGDRLGWSVNAAQDVIVAAASFAPANLAQGVAYVYERDAGGSNNWGLVKELIASDPEDGADFGGGVFGGGVSVSRTGDVIVATAKGWNGYRGAAYVYERNAGGPDNWGFVKKLVPSDAAPDDVFGADVSVDGDRIVIGAPYKPYGGPDNMMGAAYIFERNAGGPNNWGQMKKLTASDGIANDLFGMSVSMEGDRIVIEASNSNPNEKDHPNAAYVFERDVGGSDNWGEVKKLSISDGVKNQVECVRQSGDVIVIGSGWHTVGGNYDQGAAYVFERNAGGPDNWGQTKQLVASDGATKDEFGLWVNVLGDRIYVGAPSYRYETTPGAVYVFERNTGGTNNWGQATKITASDGSVGDLFGGFLGVSGNMLVAGAPYHTVGTHAEQGAAYIYYYGTPTAAWVDDDYSVTNSGGHVWGYDAFTNIQEGINVIATSGTVNVAEGTYTEQVTVARSLNLSGAGKVTTTIVAPSSGRTFITMPNGLKWDYVVGANPAGGAIAVKVEGFTIDGNSTGPIAPATMMFGAMFNNVSGPNAGISGCEVKNLGAISRGIGVYGNSLLAVAGNTVGGYDREGIDTQGNGEPYVTSDDPVITVVNNTVMGSSSARHGIFAEYGAVITSLTGNTISNHSSVTVPGEAIHFYDRIAAMGVTVSSNTISDCFQGVALYHLVNSIVKCNTITGCQQFSMLLDATCDGTIIGGDTAADGNTLTMSSPSDCGYQIYVTVVNAGTGSNTMKYNTISGGQRAMQFDGPPGITGTTTVSNNTISGQEYGGICAFNNGNLIISGNTLANVARPIEVFGPVNVTITGNTLDGFTCAGINLNAFTGVANIDHNTIVGVVEGDHGIFAQSSGAGLSIRGNIIHDIGENGVQVDAAAVNVNIDSNEIYDIAGYAGVSIDTGAVGAKINNNYIHNNTKGGVAASAQTAEFNNNRILTNGFGVVMGSAGATFILRNNSIAGNDPDGTAGTLYGLSAGGLSLYAGAADASSNYWGAADGPGPVGRGSGDKISVNVTYFPWYTDAAMTVLSTPLAIITQPQSQTKAAGSAVSFTVAASGTAPFSYQWQKGVVD